MPVDKLREFLDTRGIRYVTIAHSPAFTAQQVAASAHIHGKEMAKTVIVKLDGELAMVVVPASYNVVPELVRQATGAARVEFATEREFEDAFPGCEVGAMPPFGNLYGLRVLVDQSLAEDREIAFNAGSHTELVQMAYADFERLAEPQLDTLSCKAFPNVPRPEKWFRQPAGSSTA